MVAHLTGYQDALVQFPVALSSRHLTAAFRVSSFTAGCTTFLFLGSAFAASFCSPLWACSQHTAAYCSSLIPPTPPSPFIAPFLTVRTAIAVANVVFAPASCFSAGTASSSSWGISVFSSHSTSPRKDRHYQIWSEERSRDRWNKKVMFLFTTSSIMRTQGNYPWHEMQT